MSLTPEDQAKRDEWLVRVATYPYRHMVYVGRDITIKDVERWLRDLRADPIHVGSVSE